MQSRDLYDTYHEGKHWYAHPAQYAESFADFLMEHSFEGPLIDIGCGSGRDVDFFHAVGLDALGIDSSEAEIRGARERFPDSRFEIQDAEHLAFPDGSVGAFFMINIIHYLDQKLALRGIFMALRPGGHLFVHFNLEIKDGNGTIDYFQKEGDILSSVSDFEIIRKRELERIDQLPKPHTHRILELILQKK